MRQCCSSHVVRHGTARHGPGTARPGTARHGTARPGTARHGTARPGTARHGTARPGADLQVDDHFEHLVLVGLGLGLGPWIERDLCDEVSVPQHLSQVIALSVRAAAGSNAIR
jgi:hypothetical protein